MTQRDVTSWLPNLLGPTDFQVNDAPQSLPKRSTINLTGSVSVSDNPTNDSTDIAINKTVGFRLISSGTSSTALISDEFVSLKVSGVYNLSIFAGAAKGQALIVKDQQGDAGTYTKTITAPTGQTIDGSPTITITSNYGKVALCFDGVSDWMS